MEDEDNGIVFVDEEGTRNCRVGGGYHTSMKEKKKEDDGDDCRNWKRRRKSKKSAEDQDALRREEDGGNASTTNTPTTPCHPPRRGSIVQEGWLLFKRHTRGHWKCRWAVMERTGAFKWYTRKGTKKEEWNLGNGKYTVKERLESHHKFCFEISNPSWFRKSKIRATCEKDYLSWLQVMRRAVEGTLRRHGSGGDEVGAKGTADEGSRDANTDAVVTATASGTNLNELRNFSSASSEDDASEFDCEDGEGRRHRTWRKAQKYIRRLAKRSSSNRHDDERALDTKRSKNVTNAGDDDHLDEGDGGGERAVEYADGSRRRRHHHRRRRVGGGMKGKVTNSVSAVLKVTHGVHIEYDPETGTLVGLPDEWSDLASAEQKQHKATAIALETDARYLLKSNDAMFGGGDAQIDKIVVAAAGRFEEAACERRFARDLEAADEDFRMAAMILFASGHLKKAYQTMGTCAQMWSMERVDASEKLSSKSRAAEQRKRLTKFETRARASLTSAMEYRELAEAISPIETNMTVYAIERALANDGESDTTSKREEAITLVVVPRERKLSPTSIVATSKSSSSTTTTTKKTNSTKRPRPSQSRRRSSGDIVISPRCANKAARRRASLSNKTSTAMLAEGFSTLAFLAVVSETRSTNVVPAVLTRRRSDAQFAAYGSQARGGSSVVHYLSDFVVKIPSLRKVPSRVSSLRAIAGAGAGGVPTEDTSDRNVFQVSFEGRIPSAAKEEIRRLRRTIDDFNRVLDSTASQISPALHKRHRGAVDPATRGLAKLERLGNLIRQGLKDLHGLKCFVWPSDMRKGHLWVALGHVRHFFQSLEPVLGVLLAVARANVDQEKTWWSLQSKHLVCMRQILSDRMEKMRRILESVEIARKQLRAVLKILALDYRIRMSDTMRRLESEASSGRLEASRNAMISFADSLNKCERLLADVKSTAAFNFDLLNDALTHPSDPDAVIVAVEGDGATASGATVAGDTKKNSPSPLPSSPGLNRQASRKPMVRSYALESHGIFGVHIPALNLKRFYCHWRDRCYVPVRGLDATCSEILDFVERIVVEHSDRKKVSYIDIKRRVLESFDPAAFFVVKNVVHEMLRLVVMGGQLHYVRMLASHFRITETKGGDSATTEIPKTVATTKELPPGLKMKASAHTLVDAADSKKKTGTLPCEFRGPTFQEYLLLYPYKSLAETHEVMRTRPKQSLTLQEARLLDGVGCSLVEYWHTPGERNPFRVEFTSTASQASHAPLDGSSAISSSLSSSKKVEDLCRKRADAEEATVAPRRQDSVLRWFASGSERFRGDGHRHRRGELVGTGRMQTFASGKGVAMVVLRDDAGMFVHSHLKDQFHHSSIFAGESVHFAGEIKICQGRVEWISNKSGHYQPGLRETLHMLRYLRDRGVCLKSFSCDLVDRTALPDGLLERLGRAISRIRRKGKQGEQTFLRINPASAVLDDAFPRAKSTRTTIPPLVIDCADEHSTSSSSPPHPPPPSSSPIDDIVAAAADMILPSKASDVEEEEEDEEEEEEKSTKLCKSSSSSLQILSPPFRLRRKTSPRIGLAAKRSGDRRRMSRTPASVVHLRSRDLSRSASLGHIAFRHCQSSDAPVHNYVSRRRHSLLLDPDRMQDESITWPPKRPPLRQSHSHRVLLQRNDGGDGRGGGGGVIDRKASIEIAIDILREACFANADVSEAYGNILNYILKTLSILRQTERKMKKKKKKKTLKVCSELISALFGSPPFSGKTKMKLTDTVRKSMCVCCVYVLIIHGSRSLQGRDGEGENKEEMSLDREEGLFYPIVASVAWKGLNSTLTKMLSIDRTCERARRVVVLSVAAAARNLQEQIAIARREMAKEKIVTKERFNKFVMYVSYYNNALKNLLKTFADTCFSLTPNGSSPSSSNDDLQRLLVKERSTLSQIDQRNGDGSAVVRAVVRALAQARSFARLVSKECGGGSGDGGCADATTSKVFEAALQAARRIPRFADESFDAVLAVASSSSVLLETTALAALFDIENAIANIVFERFHFFLPAFEKLSKMHPCDANGFSRVLRRTLDVLVRVPTCAGDVSVRKRLSSAGDTKVSPVTRVESAMARVVDATARAWAQSSNRAEVELCILECIADGDSAPYAYQAACLVLCRIAADYDRARMRLVSLLATAAERWHGPEGEETNPFCSALNRVLRHVGPVGSSGELVIHVLRPLTRRAAVDFEKWVQQTRNSRPTTTTSARKQRQDAGKIARFVSKLPTYLLSAKTQDEATSQVRRQWLTACVAAILPIETIAKRDNDLLRAQISVGLEGILSSLSENSKNERDIPLRTVVDAALHLIASATSREADTRCVDVLAKVTYSLSDTKARNDLVQEMARCSRSVFTLGTDILRTRSDDEIDLMSTWGLLLEALKGMWVCMKDIFFEDENARSVVTSFYPATFDEEEVIHFIAKKSLKDHAILSAMSKRAIDEGRQICDRRQKRRKILRTPPEVSPSKVTATDSDTAMTRGDVVQSACEGIEGFLHRISAEDWRGSSTSDRSKLRGLLRTATSMLGAFDRKR
eukprot:g1984.t1